MTEKLKTSLDLYHQDILKEIAENLNPTSTKVPARKGALVDEVSKRIREAASSPAFIGQLSQAERATLALLLKNSGVNTLRDIALPLIMADMIYVEGQEATLDRPRLKDILLSLMRKGLVVNLSEIASAATRRTFEPIDKFGIAPEVRADLPRKLLSLPEPVPHRHTDDTPPHVESEDPEQCLRQLFFLWAELRREPANRLKSGEIAKRDMRRIAKSLGLDAENDLERLNWIQKILQALNLLESTPETIAAVDNDAVKLFWNASPRTQLVSILKSYPTMTPAISLDMSVLNQYAYYAGLPPRPSSEIRGEVLNILKEIAEAYWFPFTFFVAFLNGGRNGSSTLADYTLNMLYNNLRWHPAGRRDELDKTLQQLDFQATAVILKELQALGVVELGYTTPGGIPSALQLTPLVRAHFTNQPFSSSGKTGQIILQPDFQLLAMGPVALSILANLERFAEREKLNESVVSYRITREASYQAFQRGESPETIRAFLEEATAQPAPQNIIRTLEEWGRQYERIIIRRNITILQVDHAEVLDKLLHNPATGALLRRLDVRTAWMRAENTAKVKAELWAQNILPTYSQGPEADLPHSLRWDQDSLRPRHPLPSLYAAGTIRRIAEETDGHWQLTPQSVHLAVATGLEIPDMIELIERMTGTPLTSEWRKQLKAWGKHYGSGQVAQVMLLRLESDDALQELRRADRRLSRWIRPLPQAPGIGVVDEKHWEEIQTLLTEWGIDVTENRWW